MTQYSPRARALAQQLRAKATRNIASKQGGGESSSRLLHSSERTVAPKSGPQTAERKRS